MINAETVKKIIIKHGNSFLIDDDSVEFFGMISPKRKNNLVQEEFMRIGALLDNEHILIYPFDELRLAENCVLKSQDKSFCIKRVDTLSLCDNIIYRFAIICEQWVGA